MADMSTSQGSSCPSQRHRHLARKDSNHLKENAWQKICPELTFKKVTCLISLFQDSFWAVHVPVQGSTYAHQLCSQKRSCLTQRGVTAGHDTDPEQNLLKMLAF